MSYVPGLCPCGSGDELSTCCQPLLAGEKKAATPEALMRSRYTAYVVKDYGYILNTYSRESQAGLNEQQLANSATDTEWLGLKIEDNSTDRVRFRAFYRAGKQIFQLHEDSLFILENGEWRYHQGDIQSDSGPLKIGRNDPCPCQSGKKFKKCCGK